MQRIVIRYLTGSRANQADVFPADSADGLVAGRDAAAAIQFDADQDDLVSRQHLKITRDDDNPNIYRLIDLQSRNGTFVNRRRIYGSTFLNHNDRIQLGAAGPEFRFELDPPPVLAAPLSGATAVFGVAPGPVPPTRGAFAPPSTREAGEFPSSRPIGRATVERMLDDTFGLLKQESNKSIIIGLICIGSILLVGLGTWFYLRENQRASERQIRKSEQVMQGVQTSLEQTRQDARISREDAKAQIQKAEQTHQKTLQKLVAEITRLRKEQAAQMERQTQLAAASRPTAASGAIPTPSTPTFGQLIERVDTLLSENNYPEAEVVANQLITMSPARYEGYYLGGVSALQQRQNARARDLLKQAIAKAPLDRQTPLQQLLTEAEDSKQK